MTKTEIADAQATIRELCGIIRDHEKENALLRKVNADLLACCDAVLSAWHNRASNRFRKEPAYLEAIRIAINKATLNPESEA